MNGKGEDLQTAEPSGDWQTKVVDDVYTWEELERRTQQGMQRDGMAVSVMSGQQACNW